MPPMVTGILIGVVSCLIIAWVVSRSVVRRVVALERRTREAERLAELGTLTGGLAHEIKNPLSTVQLNLQLLAEDIGPEHASNSRVLNRLRTVQRETSRLKDTLDDFLRFAGKIEVEKSPVDLHELIEELVDFFIPQAAAQKSRVRIMPYSGKLVANVDAKLIKQAVLNLMINGLQAMPQGGELILSAKVVDGMAQIEVTDTGKGISPEALEKIFQAYYSTKKGGTGLGLAMAQRIAREHGGELSVRSEVGKGSCFVLRVPVGN